MHIRILSKFSLLVFLFSLFASIQVYGAFQKSLNDHREYLAFELENRMRVLVISDPETDDAAASLAIQIGGGDDPENRAGMAHYLEHMLFLGTEKYPELDSYRTFIEQNGGATNAYTAIDLTNYNFSIDPDSLKPALDRFAQFFVAPLFPAEQVSRERGVVHAEFEMRTQRDVVRNWAAMRHAYNPKHPSSKFVTGTEKTLEGDVRPDLIEFFNENYSANLMNLVVLGREPVNELQKWVVEIFSEIKDSDADVLEITEPLFADGSLPALLKVRTLKNNPSLTLTFPVPDLEPYWRESPDGYISNLLGHEGKGSLLSELKAEGWADGLYVSPGNPGINSYTMTVKISLTESGHQNWENVTAYVFQYIREIRVRGIDEWRFNEQKILSEIGFRFSEVDDARNFVTTLAAVLHKYPPNEILSALYLVSQYDPNLITTILAEMTPENTLAVLPSSTTETDKLTPYLGVEYSLDKLPDQTIELWHTDLADSSNWLPTANEFLPQNLNLKTTDEVSKPERIIAKPGFELWHQMDTSFDVPRASFFISVRSPVTKTNVKNSVLLSLFEAAINDQLNEFAYPAALAGLDYSLYGHSRGFTIRISGFDDKQSVLLGEIISIVKSPTFDRSKFELHRDQLIRDIENSRRDSAYRRAISEFYSIIVEPSWTEEQELQALTQVEFEDLVNFSSKLIEEVDVVVLSHGNVLRDEAIAMGELVESNLLNPERVATVRKSDVIDLPDHGPFIRQIGIENNDSAIAIYLQGPDRSLRERAYFALLAQIIQTPFFSDLRSVQQLGYVVFSANVPVGQVPGTMFVIQSPDVPPEKMEVAVVEFLDQFHSWLVDLSSSEFEAYRAGLIGQILEKDPTLNDRSYRYWTAIDQKDYEFNQQQELASILETMERKAFEDFVYDLLIKRGDSRLVVLGYGNNHGMPVELLQTEGVHIADRESFKRGQELFPPL